MFIPFFYILTGSKVLKSFLSQHYIKDHHKGEAEGETDGANYKFLGKSILINHLNNWGVFEIYKLYLLFKFIVAILQPSL